MSFPIMDLPPQKPAFVETIKVDTPEILEAELKILKVDMLALIAELQKAAKILDDKEKRTLAEIEERVSIQGKISGLKTDIIIMETRLQFMKMMQKIK